jgi:hypothetical protein
MAKDRRWILQYKSPLGDDYIKIFRYYSDAKDYMKEVNNTIYKTDSAIIEAVMQETEHSIKIFCMDCISIEIIK